VCDQLQWYSGGEVVVVVVGSSSAPAPIISQAKMKTSMATKIKMEILLGGVV